MCWKTGIRGALQLLTVLGFLPLSASAQLLPPCSWPLKTDGTGITNVAYPDTNATYWTMPFDATRWKSIVITGTYPRARFFSFVSYVANGSVVSDNGSLIDKDINPDSGNSNPFRRGAIEGEPGQYTVTASRSAPPDGGSNFLQLGATKLAWIIYRIYVPNEGLGEKGGVPLPSVAVVGEDGRSHDVPPCPARNDSPATVAPMVSAVTPAACQPTPLVSWIPKNTGGYFPNPANKYIAVPGLCFQPDRIVVIRGKGAVFPNTYNGGPIWEPKGIKMRYWSMCNNKQRTPYPVVACEADRSTALDEEGFYTYVVSEPELGQGAKEAPAWVPAGVTWLPWGSPNGTDILIFRNMLPKPTFQHSVQEAINAGCVVDNQSGVAPPRDEVVAAGECAHSVMKKYYPQAVYCQKQVFINEGWQGCFAAAEADAE